MTVANKSEHTVVSVDDHQIMESRRRGTRERKSSLKGTEALEQEPDSEEEVTGKQRAEEEARKATVLRRRQGKQMQEATISPPTSGTSATISSPTSPHQESSP
jgi:hypothetical protein